MGVFLCAISALPLLYLFMKPQTGFIVLHNQPAVKSLLQSRASYVRSALPPVFFILATGPCQARCICFGLFYRRSVLQSLANST